AQRGRPIDSTYWSWEAKREFMRQHGIDVSVVSLANPWLDFVAPSEAAEAARRVNDEMERVCWENNNNNDRDGNDSLADANTATKSKLYLYAFATLPLTAATTDEVVAEIRRVKTLP